MTPGQATFVYVHCMVLAVWGLFAWGWREKPWRSLALITVGAGVGVLFGGDWNARNGYPVGPSPFGWVIVLAAIALLVRGEWVDRRQRRLQHKSLLAREFVAGRLAMRPMPSPPPRRRRRRRR